MKKKSKFLTFIFTLVPGAGHLYLGLQRQGLQLLTLFTLCIFLSGWLNTGLLAVFIPIIWFYSFFDAMNKVSADEKHEDIDVLLISWLNKSGTFMKDKGRIIGYSLIFFGCFLLFERIVLPELERILTWQVREYFRTGVVALLLIAGGVKLALGSRENGTKDKGGVES